MKCSQCALEKAENEFYFRKTENRYRSNCIACCSKVASKYYSSNKEKHGKASRKYSLRINYKLSVEKYLELGEKQGWICLVCNHRKAECVDHDHFCCPGKVSCGKCIRGLLCKQCNSGMGVMQDDPQTLRNGANYIDSFRGKLVS